MEDKQFIEGKRKKIRKIAIISAVTILAGGATYVLSKSKNVDAILRASAGMGKKVLNIPLGTVINPETKIADILTDKVANKFTYSEPFSVNEHIRNIPGRHASAKKVIEAFEKSIKLGEEQTLVGSYVKGIH